MGGCVLQYTYYWLHRKDFKMGKTISENDFTPLNIAIMTVSDSRSEVDDKSGPILVERLEKAGHHLAEKKMVIDDVYQMRAVVSQWIADPEVHAVITTGGTGLTGRDVTPEAMRVLYDKEIDGFGEVFRSLTYDVIKTSTIQSRAVAGLANGTVIFSLPGSPGACKDGWDWIISQQLDLRTKPCNLVEIMPRFLEK